MVHEAVGGGFGDGVEVILVDAVDGVVVALDNDVVLG